MSVFQVPENCDTLCVNDVEELLGMATGSSYLMHSGHVVPRSQLLQPGIRYHIFPRVLGGKGGFGSMLRAIGAQIEKTTSREACRDLSGRRIRDVNNEKKLKEWVTKQQDRQQEKLEREERRRVKRAKYLEETPSKMDDPQYNAEYAKIMKNSELAMQKGLSKLKGEESTSRKRKAETCSGSGLDSDRWAITAGLALEDLDSDSSSESGNNDEAAAVPGFSAPHTMSASSSSSSPSSTSQETPESLQGARSGSVASATVTSSSQAAEGASPCKMARLDRSASGEDASSNSSFTQQAGASAEGSKESGAEASVLKGQAAQDGVSRGAVSSPEKSTEPIDLDQFSSAEDLQATGLDRLKADLMRRGLKCGGNLQERAQRLFSVKGLSAQDIPAKLLAKGKGQGKSSQK